MIHMHEKLGLYVCCLNNLIGRRSNYYEKKTC
jgi:hypothetical protein